MATTQLSDMINPQVLTAMVSAQLPKRLAFTGVSQTDTTLTGRAGNTVTVPRYKYIGDATDVAEGAAIDMAQLTVGTQQATVKKAGIGVQLTDEAALGGYGDPITEAVRQIALSIASKVDNDTLEAARNSTLNITAPIDLDLVSAADAAFIDNPSVNNIETDDTATGVLFLNPKDADKLRKLATNNWTSASELSSTIMQSGTFGELFGWQIARTRKLSAGEYVFALPNAFKTYMKRDVMIETSRDITKKLTNITGDEHYTVVIDDDSKVLYGKAAAASGGSTTPTDGK